MSIFLQIAIVLIGAAVIFSISWALSRTMRTPVRCGKDTDLATIVSIRNSAQGLEQTLEGLIWLRDNGVLEGQILIADCGVDEEGLALARLAVKKYGKIAFCKAEEVAQWIGETP